VTGLSALEKDAQESLKLRPVMKVVRMLEDTLAELNKELEDDKAVYEMLTCWCETNEKEKTKAIAEGEATAAALEADMGEFLAKMKEIKEHLAQTKAAYNDKWESLKKAKSMRMTENKEFHANEVDLMEAIKAAADAITVLSKHHPELAQLREVAQLLQRSKVPELVLSKDALSGERAELLRSFLKQASTATSFLAIPGFQSYAPQSGQIFGILKQMKETFEKDLAAAQGEEGKAVSEHAELQAASEEELAAGKKLWMQLEAEFAEFGEKHAAAFKEYEDTLAQLALDREFLADLKKKCAASDEEFQARTKSRLEEIAAVEDTIKYLNSDEAYDVFDKTVNTAFVQTVSVSKAETAMRQEAVTVLKRAASHALTPAIALLAVHVQLDAFTKVIAEIDRLVAELKVQMSDEVAHRDWCIDELNKNERETSAANDKRDNLVAKIEDLTSTIKTLTETIESHTATIAETQEQMKRASAVREGENTDYQQTMVDQRLTQMILRKALDRMKAVYFPDTAPGANLELLEGPGAPHIATSGTHTDAGNGPARFTKYEQNAGGARIVAMIETIIGDSKTMEDEAITAEQDAQTAYENFMKDSNESITKLTEAINNMTEARAKAKADKTMAETDLKDTVATLEDLHNTNLDLHKSCDYILKNFDARQAARAAEIDALGEAKAILSGMK